MEMLREWVHTVGIAAGLDPTHVSLLTGAIGSPESSVEMEIAGFGNMAGEFLFIFVLVWAIRVTSVVFCSLQVDPVTDGGGDGQGGGGPAARGGWRAGRRADSGEDRVG